MGVAKSFNMLIREVNTYEEHTLIPFLETIRIASEFTHNMYKITYQLPESKHLKSTLLNIDVQQRELLIFFSSTRKKDLALFWVRFFS